MKSFKDLGIKPDLTGKFVGRHIEMDKILNCEIIIHKFDIQPTKSKTSTNPNCLYLQIEYEGEYRVTWKGSNNLMKLITKVKAEDFPFKVKITKETVGGYDFTN